MGSGGIAPFLNSALDMSGQLHASAAVPRGIPRISVGWAAEPFWTLWRGEKSFLCRESNPYRPARRHTDGAIPARTFPAIKPQNVLVLTFLGAPRITLVSFVSCIVRVGPSREVGLFSVLILPYINVTLSLFLLLVYFILIKSPSVLLL
jgi:hypothetical protein